MKSSRTATGAIRYDSLRLDEPADSAGCSFEYVPTVELPESAPESLEFFLIERYRLYASSGGRLWRGAVFHNPYPLARAEVPVWNDHLLALNGFASTGRRPDHVGTSPGVDVSVFSLESCLTSAKGQDNVRHDHSIRLVRGIARNFFQASQRGVRAPGPSP